MTTPPSDGAGQVPVPPLPPHDGSPLPTDQQPGYPPAGQPAYPPAGQPGYAPTGQPGYPPQPGYAPTGQPGYPPQPGYAPTGQPGYAPGQPPQGYAPAAPLLDSDQRTWAMLAHLSGFLSIIATIVIWAVYKDKGTYVREQATEALNFQITLFIASAAVTVITVITAGIGAILFLGLIAGAVFMIMAAIATNKGEPYRYPINWRMIS